MDQPVVQPAEPAFTMSKSRMQRAAIGRSRLCIQVRDSVEEDPGCLRGEGWWSQPGSNRRPQACKASALPTELWPRSQDRLRKRRLVGPGRVERPTSRLSGVRSNHLSYEPRFEKRIAEVRDQKVEALRSHEARSHAEADRGARIAPRILTSDSTEGRETKTAADAEREVSIRKIRILLPVSKLGDRKRRDRGLWVRNLISESLERR